MKPTDSALSGSRAESWIQPAVRPGHPACVSHRVCHAIALVLSCVAALASKGVQAQEPQLAALSWIAARVEGVRGGTLRGIDYPMKRVSCGSLTPTEPAK
jgi:hypothetical protein